MRTYSGHSTPRGSNALYRSNIAKGQTEVKLEVKPAANAALGSFPITVTGKSKFQNKDFSVNSAAVPLLVILICVV